MPASSCLSLSQLSHISLEIRQDIIKMLVKAKSGHPAGALGLADVLTALYFVILNHDPKKPNWPERDRLILSNGHTCPVLYAALARAGYFPVAELAELRQLGSRLQGHPHRLSLPGIEASTGSLGQGLSQAIGMALAGQLDKKSYQTYCILGDGELQEGQVWEAFMLAGKYRLSRLTAIIDRNNIQIDGHTEEVMPLEPLVDKLTAFNWHVLEIDGHNHEEIIDACQQAKAIFEQPVVIIAHTIPGYGVEFMEGDPAWHGQPPSPQQGKIALQELASSNNKKINYG